MVKTSPFNAGDEHLIPQGVRIPHASSPKNQNIKQEQYCNQFTKDFKNGPPKKKKLKNIFWTFKSYEHSCTSWVYVFCLGHIPGCIAGSYNSMFKFWGTGQWFFKVAAPFSIPTSSAPSSHHSECEVVSHCSFDVHVPNV